MKGLIGYRILTYILLPIELLLGFMALIMLLVALANPAALLPVFLLSCTVIYVFCSFTFLKKGIDNAKPCKKSLKDWIKVNAYVSIAFCSLSIAQSVSLLINPALINEAMTNAIEMQKSTMPSQITPALMMQVMKGVLIFMLCFSAGLSIHIFSTFRLLKQYDHVFDKE